MLKVSKQILFLLAVLWSVFQPIYAKKNLVLIICSNNLPVYKIHQESWRYYMHAFKEDFESYFLQIDENLEEEYRLVGDILWIKGKESIRPGILEKTIKGFKFFLDRKGEFDYVIRPSLSSFLVLPRLKSFLKNVPKTRFYGGNLVEHFDGGNLVEHFISGACFILSMDLMESMAMKEQYFLGRRDKLDDVVIGNFLVQELSIQPLHHPNYEFVKNRRPQKIASSLPKEVFHFRIKVEHHREGIEKVIHNDLLNIFYPTIMKEKKLKRKVFS